MTDRINTIEEVGKPSIEITEERMSERAHLPDKELIDFFGLSQDAFDHLTGTNGGAVVEEIQSIKGLLERQFEPAEIERWLHAQNAKFDGKTPVEAILEGQTTRILHLLIRLEEGIHY